jgi:hypothetical protein
MVTANQVGCKERKARRPAQVRGQNEGQRNPALRAHRLARGWTQDDGASALQELIEMLGESRPPLDGNLWGKWERGDQAPDCWSNIADWSRS